VLVVPDNLEESKIALVYGQMNEPPGARMRIALTGLSLAEQFRGVSAVGSYPFCGGLPANTGDRHGCDARAYCVNEVRFNYIRSGRLRSCGRPDRPSACDIICALGRDNRS